MTAPKTLHLTNAYHPTSGGISTFYRALLQGAEIHRRPMRLVVPSEGNRIEDTGDYGRIYHVAAKPSKLGDSRYRILWSWGQTGKQVLDIIRVEQPDLVEIADKYTLPAMAGDLRKGWVQGIRHRPILVGTSHERMDNSVRTYLGIGALSSLLSRYFMWQYYFPMFDWHIANSAYTQQELLSVSKGHRLHREMRIAPMGVDCDAFDPMRRTAATREQLCAQLQMPANSHLLLYAGRVAAEKNLGLLRDAMRILPPEYLLIVAGEGELKNSLAAQLGGRARFTGHVKDRAELASLYAAADIFVHPNPREPFGIAPLEAMAAGLPLVAPNSGGVLSYANTENAWLADASPAAFANAIVSVSADDPERHRKIRLARIAAERLHWPRVAESFFALYDEMVAMGWPLDPPTVKYQTHRSS